MQQLIILKFIVDEKIGVGSLVLMRRSGDVIPIIDKVITPAAKPKLPDQPWEWNSTHVDAILKNIKSNETVIEKNISRFFNKLDVGGFGPGNVKRVIKANYDSVPKILRMTEKDFLKSRRF